jgi:hypothetical protein
MRCHCLRTIGAIACLVAVTAARADAQLAELQPGARVRVHAPEVVAGRLEAVVIARTRDTVTLTTPRGRPIPVPLAAITAAEVRRGRSHSEGAVKGLKLGTGIGLAMGLLSAIGYDAGSDPCGSEPCENDFTPGELVAAGFITGATLGAGIGAMVGAEHWERLTIPARVLVRRDRDRLTLGLAISF